MAVCLAAFSTAAFATPGNPVNNTFCALATPVTSGGLQEGGEFVGDAMAAICDDLAAYTTDCEFISILFPYGQFY